MQLNETVKIDQKMIDEVITDDEFRVGFEFEFHAINAIDLIDSAGDDDDDDDQYGFAYLDRLGDFEVDDEGWEKVQAVLEAIRPHVSAYLGLNFDDITIETGPNDQSRRDYSKWTLTTDLSLYVEDRAYGRPESDFGLELISPIMPIKQGLQALHRVRQMMHDFRLGHVVFQTSAATSVHINLSHTDMKTKTFDYAKVALLAGDDYYLKEFQRESNQYAKPILAGLAQRLYSVLSRKDISGDARENLERSHQGELHLFSLADWDTERVLQEIANQIPMEHLCSIDMSRLRSDNPYLEFRMAGNAGYEDRIDLLTKMVLRFAALIRIGLDPDLFRREYLIKAYRLLVSVSRAAEGSPIPLMNNVRIYLRDIMVGPVRDLLNKLQTRAVQKLLSEADSYWVLYLIRTALDMKQNTVRTRKGLAILAHQILGVSNSDLMSLLRTERPLFTYGVLRRPDLGSVQVKLGTEMVKDVKTGKEVPQETRKKISMPDQTKQVIDQIKSVIDQL